MPSPPFPPQLEHLKTRRFSFYPAILHIERNEWVFRRATWSDVLVVNCKSGEEISIPRWFLGDVSCVEDPVLIVGLTRELEYNRGVVLPCQRRVIEMPLAVGSRRGASPGKLPRSEPAPVVAIRMAPANNRRVIRLIAGVVVFVILLYVVVVTLARITTGSFRTTGFPTGTRVPNAAQ